MSMERRNHYDADVAGRFDSLRSWGGNVVERTVSVAGIDASSRVLDLGCGTGNLMAKVHEATGARCDGLDLSADMLRVAAGKMPAAGFCNADVSAIPFLPNTYNSIVGAYFIHHVPPERQPEVLTECYRVLSMGTAVILTASHSQIERSQVGRFFPEIIDIDKRRFPPVDEVCNWFQDSGFEHVGSETAFDDPIPLGEAYLAKVEHRHISTFAFLSARAYRRGLETMREYVRRLDGRTEYRDRPVTLVFGSKVKSSSVTVL